MGGTLPETDAVQYECLVECGEGVGQGGDDCCQADVVTNAIATQSAILATQNTFTERDQGKQVAARNGG